MNRNKYFKEYRNKNREKLKKYNREYMRKRRKTLKNKDKLIHSL